MKSEANIAWLAGIFDGEGCVYVQRSRRTGGRVVHSLELTLANTSAVMVEKYVAILRDLNVSPRIVFERRFTKRPIYYVKVAKKKEALVLARTILPHLTARREEVLMAIWYLERSCKTRQHVASPQDVQVLDAITGVKHGRRISKAVRSLIETN